MLLTQTMTASSITDALAEYDTAGSPYFTYFIAMVGALIIVGIGVGIIYLSTKIPQKVLRYLVGCTSVPVVVALFSVASPLTQDVKVKDYAATKNIIETTVHDELTDQYRIQDVEIEEFTSKEGSDLGVIHWARSLTEDSLEPAKVIVRIEDGPVVPYEVRLVNNTLQLYTLHGDTSVPDPQHILR